VERDDAAAAAGFARGSFDGRASIDVRLLDLQAAATAAAAAPAPERDTVRLRSTSSTAAV
jgi:hypothetical protein